jgi:hypothetical protein
MFASEQVTGNYCLDSYEGMNGVHIEKLQMTPTQVKDMHIHATEESDCFLS